MRAYRTLRHIAVGAVPLMFGLLVARPATAQENKTAARALAIEGSSAYQAGDDARAIELLTKAEKFYHATPHLLLMAKAHLRLGHLVEARELLLAIVHEPLPEKANEVLVSTRDEAEGLAGPLDARIPTLTLRVGKDVKPTPTVTLDGVPIDPALLDVAQPLNPGQHKVVAAAEGFQPYEGAFEVAESARVEHEVPMLLPLDPVAAEPRPVEAPSAASRDLTLPIVSYGVGAVGIGAGVVLLVLAGSDSSAADAIARDECSAGVNGSLVCSQDESDRITGLDADAATKQTLAWVGFGVGAVGAALGTYFLLAPSSSGERATAKLPTIAPLPGGAFVSYRASF